MFIWRLLEEDLIIKALCKNYTYLIKSKYILTEYGKYGVFYTQFATLFDHFVGIIVDERIAIKISGFLCMNENNTKDATNYYGQRIFICGVDEFESGKAILSIGYTPN